MVCFQYIYMVWFYVMFYRRGFSVVCILFLSLLKNIESHFLPWELPQNRRPSMQKMGTTEKQNEMINESPC